eukprot:5243013-Amphidinium_carterae.1
MTIILTNGHLVSSAILADGGDSMARYVIVVCLHSLVYGPKSLQDWRRTPPAEGWPRTSPLAAPQLHNNGKRAHFRFAERKY